MQLELFSASELWECLRKTCTKIFIHAHECFKRLDFVSCDYYMKEFDVIQTAFRSRSGCHRS